MTRNLLVALLLPAIPASVQAQRGPGKCGSPHPSSLETIRGWFTDPDLEDFRTSAGIPALGEDVAGIVLTDDRVCSEVLKAGLKYAKSRFRTKYAGRNFDHAIYKVASFYVLVLTDPAPDPTDPNARASGDPAAVLIMDTGTLKLRWWGVWP